MSQNITETSSMLGPVRVRAGWDAPLEEIYCNVELLGTQPDLDAPTCFHEFVYADIGAMILALSEAKISLPDGMRRAIEEDIRLHAGNVIRRF